VVTGSADVTHEEAALALEAVRVDAHSATLMARRDARRHGGSARSRTATLSFRHRRGVPLALFSADIRARSAKWLTRVDIGAWLIFARCLGQNVGGPAQDDDDYATYDRDRATFARGENGRVHGKGHRLRIIDAASGFGRSGEPIGFVRAHIAVFLCARDALDGSGGVNVSKMFSRIA
jgi:hypothetical protein